MKKPAFEKYVFDGLGSNPQVRKSPSKPLEDDCPVRKLWEKLHQWSTPHN